MEIVKGSKLTVYNPSGYVHCGVYIGNNKVIHFQSNLFKSKPSMITISTLEEFSNNQQIIASKINCRYSDKEVIQRAESCLGLHTYDLFFNNCEHFCNYVYFNTPRSEQVEYGSKVTGWWLFLLMSIAFLSLASVNAWMKRN